jgi:protein-disulfide isomerase
MFCIAALLVFSILGIFSATHRKLAMEALDCVFRRVTFRPCVSGFREKVQARILGRIMTRSVTLARLLNKHFELLSWIFLIFFTASTVWVARGGYNYYMYGNCNGLNSGGFCLFDPGGENSKVSPVSQGCSVTPPSESNITMDSVDLSIFPDKNPGGKDSIFFIGCYSCEYTRKTYPVIKDMLAKNDISFTFAHFPVKDDTRYLSSYDYCAYKLDPAKFWDLNDKFFATDMKDLDNSDFIFNMAVNMGFDKTALESCLKDPATETAVLKQFQEIQKTNLYGTPTIFINGKPVVGPKPVRVYERLLGHPFYENWFGFLK